MIIFAVDALEHSLVKKFICKNLMQLEYGKTDITDFRLDSVYHIVLWGSFLKGRNIESDQDWKTKFTWFGWWEFKVKPEETFLAFFNTYKAIDVPSISLRQDRANLEREVLQKYYDGKATTEDFDQVVWKIHEENKNDFLNSLGKYDLVMGYFDLADAIGHLSFGDVNKMRTIYMEIEQLFQKVKSSTDDFILVVSDHGMKLGTGTTGDHTRYGFYSINRKLKLRNPKIFDFYGIIRDISKRSR